MTRDRKIVENQGVPEYATYADLPLPTNYQGMAITRDTYTLYKSNGVTWVKNDLNQITRLMCYGDSITTLCNSYYAFIVGSDTGVVSNGVLTLTKASGSWNILPGAEFYIQNTTNDVYVGKYTVATATTSVLTALAPTKPDGTLTFNSNTYLVKLWLHQDSDFIGQACWRSNGALKRGYTIGFSGQTSSYVLSKFDEFIKDIPNPENTIFCEFSGINDINGGTVTGQQTFDYRKQIWEKARLMGFKVCIFTIGPVNNTNGGYTATTANETVKHNNLCKKFVRDNPDYLLYDQYATCADPLSQYPNFKTNYLPAVDTIHRSGIAASAMGADLWTMLNANLNFNRKLLVPRTPREVYANVGGEWNVLDNAMGLTTAGAKANGGTMTGGSTGDAFTNWRLSVVSAATVAGLVVARSDGFGYNQRITFTANADTNYCSFQSLNSIPARIPAGKRVVITAELTMSSMVNIRQMYVYAQLTAGGINHILSPTFPLTNIIDVTDKTLTFEFGDLGFVTPAACDLFLFFQPMTNAAGSGVIEVGNISVRYY